MNEIVTRIDDLAAQIKAEHLAFERAAQSAIEHALKCGDLLLEAKKKVGHGKWLPWLKNECGVSERSAQAYMQAAKHRTEIAALKSAVAADLTLSAALKAIGKKVEPDDPAKRRASVTRFMKAEEAKVRSASSGAVPIKTGGQAPRITYNPKEDFTPSDVVAIKREVDEARASGKVAEVETMLNTLEAANEIAKDAKTADDAARARCNEGNPDAYDVRAEREFKYLAQLWKLLFEASKTVHWKAELGLRAIMERDLEAIMIGHSRSLDDGETRAVRDAIRQLINTWPEGGAAKAAAAAQAETAATEPVAAPATAPAQESSLAEAWNTFGAAWQAASSEERNAFADTQQGTLSGFSRHVDKVSVVLDIKRAAEAAGIVSEQHTSPAPAPAADKLSEDDRKFLRQCLSPAKRKARIREVDPHDPEMLEKIESGDISLDAAEKELGIAA